jgi:hypothetical protein
MEGRCVDLFKLFSRQYEGISSFWADRDDDPELFNYLRRTRLDWVNMLNFHLISQKSD